ncbi:proteoglycan Cow [Plodia interpunctella]|uniref:proteoglycan Cow n=1 Tax=Plodia interpunctella TaxID=58824 RepID=UPI002367E6A7|nr:proteoglycan Cow [Plodia interpunctella]
MRARVWLAAAAALAVAAARDQDFEFDDDADANANPGAAHARRPRRYIYDPHNSLCQSLVCKKREVCLLRDAFTALCINKKEVLRRGDVIVTSTTAKSIWEEDGASNAASSWSRDGDDDVFYDGGARVDPPEPDAPDPEPKPERCVGCPGRVRARFLCGSDNRTYSSLCRLDLHNCVRRPAAPVRPACRGFCPCKTRARSYSRSRPVTVNDDYDYDWRRRKSDSGHNEVLPERSYRRRLNQGEGCALDKMANRLLDWFSVLMEEAGATTAPEEGFPDDCKPEVRWMFSHLDTDRDGFLSAANLYSLRHDERERCLRPFLASCGGGGGGSGGRGGGGAEAGGVSRGAWCGCLRRAARPCIALARAHPDPHPGAYVPSCDARGYYRPRQCHAALGVCWCVDAHGAERPGSRGKGAPACPGEAPSPSALSNETAEAGAPDDDEDAAGSGDRDLRF